MAMYEKGWGDTFGYLGRRALMLVAKLAGFKSFCLLLTTWLLYRGMVGEDVWLTVMVTVICSASGIRLADTLDAAGLFRREAQGALRSTGNTAAYRNTVKEYGYEDKEDGGDRNVGIGNGDRAAPRAGAGGEKHGSGAADGVRGTDGAPRAGNVSRATGRAVRRSAALEQGRERIRRLCERAAAELR